MLDYNAKGLVFYKFKKENINIGKSTQKPLFTFDMKLGLGYLIDIHCKLWNLQWTLCVIMDADAVCWAQLQCWMLCKCQPLRQRFGATPWQCRTNCLRPFMFLINVLVASQYELREVPESWLGWRFYSCWSFVIQFKFLIWIKLLTGSKIVL